MKISHSLNATHADHIRQRHGIKKIKPEASIGLKKIFHAELKDAYWAEKMLVEEIPQIIKSTTAKDLIKALEYYHKISEEHISDLEAIFFSIHQNAVAVKFEAMSGMIKDIKRTIAETENRKVKDFEIVTGIKRIELYMITSYSILRYFAKTLLEENVVVLLQTILNEERTTETRFSEIAEAIINSAEAVAAD